MNQIFDLSDERYTIHHLTGQVRSVIVQRLFCPLHIRYIFPFVRFTSVTHTTVKSVSLPFFVCYLSVTYALLMHFMRSLHVLRIPSYAVIRLQSTGEHWTNIFRFYLCPFGVRYPYPLICDSTIKYQQNRVSRVNFSFCIFTMLMMIMTHFSTVE